MRRARRRPRYLLLLSALVAAITLAACGSSPTASRTVDPPSAPLATSFSAGGSEWALVPMGDLGNEAETFWQVLVTSSPSRVRDVTPKGVADNGGLVAAVSGGRVVVGFLASELLGFSPLAASADAGASWQPGNLTRALTHDPSAFTGGKGAFSALLGRGGAAIETSKNGLAGWRTVTTRRRIASSAAAASCRPAALTAVAPVEAGALEVGARCGDEGAVGLYLWSSARVRNLTSHLSLPLAHARAEVVLLAGGGREAVVVATSPRAESLFVVRGLAGTPAAGPTLTLPRRGRLVSIVPAGSGFLVVDTEDGADARLFTLSRRGWTHAVPLPSGTEDVVPTTAGTLALAVARSTLRVYLIASGSALLEQTLHVPIEYGSSS